MGRSPGLIFTVTQSLRFVWILAAIATFLVAVAIRMPGLEARPFHTDEANNAFILEETLQQGSFNYRIQDHHGPTLFWLAEIPLKMASIRSTAEMDPGMLRGVAVVCSAAAAAAIFLLVPSIPGAAACIAACFLILAAPFHYYGRTFIHESMLLFLTIVLLAALFRWRSSGKYLWAGLAGLAAGAMIITKENASVTVLLLGTPFFLPVSGRPSGLKTKTVLLAVVVMLVLVVSVLGLENLKQALSSHVNRGINSGHHWPWWQFLFWFVSPMGPGLPWSSWIAIPLALLAVGHRKNYPAVMPLALGFGLLFLFHSFLPYKTPWLILGPALPLVLLAGIGGMEFAKRYGPKIWIPAAILGMGLLFSETWARSFHHEVAIDNPLAYSPTDPQTEELIRDVDAFAATRPKGKDLIVQVVGPDYWPLPWLLRHYPNKGFWNDAPQQWPGDILICNPEALAWVPDPGKWNFKPYAIRPGVLVFVGTPK